MKRFLAAAGLVLATLFVVQPAPAQATDPAVDCSAVEGYYLAVIANYQDENAALSQTITDQREALDRITANGEARNVEYAAAKARIGRMTYKIAELREALKRERAH